MIERALQQKKAAVPLNLAAGQRIVMPGADPILGWTGSQNAGVAQALVFPQSLLEPRATASIEYAANLPAPGLGRQAIGAMPEARGGSQAALLASTLAGGQVSIVVAGGSRGSVAFRWVCVSAEAQSGAVWRLFLRLRTPQGADAWRAAGNDYVFDGAGFPVKVPKRLKVVLDDRSFVLSHTEGRLTCFPSAAGLVKVTRVCADGWGKRELQGLWLYPNQAIAAHFSDGAQAVIGTAAPAHVPAMAA